MRKEELIERLGRFSQTLNGIGGRLIVASFTEPVVREAHEMTLQLGCDIDDLINSLEIPKEES